MKRIELEGEIELVETEGGFCPDGIMIDGNEVSRIVGELAGLSPVPSRGGCDLGPEGSKSLGPGRIVIELENEHETT